MADRKWRDLVAQLVEHDTFNVGVTGSSPVGVTNKILYMEEVEELKKEVESLKEEITKLKKKNRKLQKKVRHLTSDNEDLESEVECRSHSDSYWANFEGMGN